MNKVIRELDILGGFGGLSIFKVTSEPGDSTRYEYVVVKNDDDYFFTPVRTSFAYPQHINYWEVKAWNGDLLELKEKYPAANPYTTAECISTVIELQERGA